MAWLRLAITQGGIARKGMRRSGSSRVVVCAARMSEHDAREKKGKQGDG